MMTGVVTLLCYLAISLPSVASQNYTEPNPRIVGGKDANRDRFPYYVALLRPGFQFTCGGTLIAPDVVLTAAHCDA
jgi:secreted trypsin-like serine protease